MTSVQRNGFQLLGIQCDNQIGQGTESLPLFNQIRWWPHVGAQRGALPHLGPAPPILIFVLFWAGLRQQKFMQTLLPEVLEYDSGEDQQLITQKSRHRREGQSWDS